MNNRRYDLVCLIHRNEDKLLRSKNPYEQMNLQTILMNLRKELQKLNWENSKRNEGLI